MLSLSPSLPPLPPALEWRVSPGLTPYPAALDEMIARAAAVREGRADELVWLVEHPPLYTAGTSAVTDELLAPDRFPVYAAGRGGRYTYHGPGQRIGYLMLDLAERGRDVRNFVHAIEAWVIEALAEFGVRAWAEPERIGIWTNGPRGEAKIGAIGVRVRRWVSFHGFSVNVAPDLSHFSGIVPCGLDYPVTSLEELGIRIGLEAFDTALRLTSPAFFNRLGRRASSLPQMA